MTTAEWIDEAIALLNAGGDQADDSALRLRVQRAGQRVTDRAWGYRNVKWRLASGSVTLTANVSSGSMPANYGNPSPHMKVFISGDKFELTFLDEGVFFQKQQLNSTSTSSRPRFYTFRGQSALGRKTIHVYPTPNAAMTLTVENYVQIPPALIDRPLEPVVAESVAGLPNGAYTYRVTFVTALGETEGGDVSNSITVALKKILLTSIPVSLNSAVTSRKLYRTAASGEQHKLLATLSDNVTTTYLDNIADGSLGANAPTPATAVSGLEQFPAQHHRTALFDALMTQLARGQGDGRSATEFPAATLSAFAQMWAEESMHHVPGRAPRYGNGWIRQRGF